MNKEELIQMILDKWGEYRETRPDLIIEVLANTVLEQHKTIVYLQKRLEQCQH